MVISQYKSVKKIKGFFVKMGELSVQIGERLKKIRERDGYSQTDFARKLDLLIQTYARYEKGERELPDSVKIKLRGLGTNIDWLLTGEGEMLQQDKKLPQTTIKQQHIKTITESVAGRFIPFLDQKASAGSGKELLDVDSCDRFICIPDSAAREDMYAIKVEGDSMYPTLKNGDVVVCEVAGWHGDGIYVIKTREFAFVKRVILQPDGYQVISDNALYPPYQVSPDEDTFIVGKVCYAIVQM